MVWSPKYGQDCRFAVPRGLRPPTPGHIFDSTSQARQTFEDEDDDEDEDEDEDDRRGTPSPGS
jgi:hypothetical protein